MEEKSERGKFQVYFKLIPQRSIPLSVKKEKSCQCSTSQITGEDGNASQI